MKKQLLILTLFILLALPSFGQILWQNTYGIPNASERVFRMRPLANGGYLLTGYQYVNAQFTTNAFTVRTNSTGDTIWTKQFMPPTFLGSTVFDFIQESNGNCILVGHGGISMNATETEGFIMKINLNGDTVWTKKIASPNFDLFYNVILSNDSGYVATGKNNGQNYLFKFNPNGTLRWKKPHQFSVADTGTFTGLHKSSNGYYLFIGSNFATARTKIIRVDENGNELYHKFTKEYSAAMVRITDEPAGNLLYTYGGKLVKLNPQGDTIWSRRYKVLNSYAVGVYAARPTDDGNYILLIGRSNGMDSDVGLIKVTPNGDVIKDTVLYRLGATETGTDIWLDAAGNYVVAGYTDNNGLGDQQLFMVALKKWTKTTVGLKENLPEQALQVYPNPTTDQLLISSDKPLSGTLTLYNLQGQKLWQQDVNQVSEQQISLQHFAKGIYLLQYQDKDGRQISKRIVKL